ncbi:MAG: 6-carboxytetrahydropterin synthase QueD [Lachnospiraceae bacterium]|nr:6-carboxytetrahydropterin synthase QueD [Lachnospiraceae bacterium]
MYYITTEAHFDSAHFLKGYEGKCSNIHGHRWKIVVKIESETLKQQGQCRGMITDFSDIKNTLKGLADSLDHKLIYEKGSLKEKTIEALKEENFLMVEVDFRPTAEEFSKYFFDKMSELNFPVKSVIVYETPTNYAIYEK